ncbi:septum site determining protein [Nocardioides dongxiaopingii]|uniref:septum site-determining protein Ssd n=1 Tax=Nocardioides sp. S-1144 TaxID=2582905 RepID=UPI0011641BF0|nr:septum site-determining protein Ssd [Nocardioides sp. S-1144]QDH10632.1 septum site determining protein [Nocardioides sp. S-1144]
MSKPRTTTTTDPAAAALVATADETLRDELLRLAAAAGVAPEVVGDAAAVLRSWARAPVVLVGADLAAAVADLAPDRRDGVHVISWGPAESDLFRAGMVLGAENVAGLPRSEGWVVETLTDLGEPGRPRGLVVGVMGGSGGAGATTLACALAQTAARTGEAVVLDCDPLGPGLDHVLGLDRADGFRWDALCETSGRLSARALRDALPRRGRLGVLTWHAGSTATLQAFAVREALSAARRGHDVVVVDLPRTADPLVDEVASRCDVLLLVVVPTVTGLASAARLCARMAGRAAPTLVVRGSGLGRHDVARATGRPVLATVPEQRRIAESIDLGLGPVRSHRGPLGRACTDLLAGLATRPAAAA